MSIADDFQAMVDAQAAAIDARPVAETPQERRQRLADDFAAAIAPHFPQPVTNDTDPTEADILDSIAKEIF
ncbi:hypothetical protein SAMN05216199_1255 [Pedococcus cremeus]|uniref:Uncharacterized protein n=1 Tax=Pedococcus cremeus TaxID=587636 RepID=A0A1H9S6A5_9MICO|nr:hypothetical protein [Pedococcus cremeus]SER79873.1 hypothetical protein SAMN05216199_1255 [Pedococcus cremeus]